MDIGDRMMDGQISALASGNILSPSVNVGRRHVRRRALSTNRKRECQSGRHSADLIRLDPGNADVQHANCRYCGCGLTRTLVTRRWYFSGALG